MEKYNFESELHRKLNERVIAPSENAWERVNLNRSKKKKARPAGWYWFAAVLMIGLGLYLSQTSVPVKNNVVTTGNKHKIEAPQKTVDFKIPTAVAVSEDRKKPAYYSSETLPQNIRIIDTPKEIVPEIAVSQAPITDLESQKANEIVANLEELSQSGAEITEKMIDDMIRKSQMEITAERLAANTQKTDPAILLAETERDMDRSFKERVFDLLHGKSGKIKIALRESNP